MFRNNQFEPVIDNYFSNLLCFTFVTVLLFSLTVHAENTSDISKFTIQRERSPEADLVTTKSVTHPEITVIEKSGTYNIKIVAIINAPARNVRHVLTDYAHIYRLNPAIEDSKVLKQEDELTYVRTEVKGCAAYFCEDLNRVEKVKVLPSGEILAEVVPETGQFKSGQTRWQVKELGDRCEVSFIADMRPDIYIPPVVSKFLVKKAIKQEAETSLVNLERYSSTLCSTQDAASGKVEACN